MITTENTESIKKMKEEFTPITADLIPAFDYFTDRLEACEGDIDVVAEGEDNTPPLAMYCEELEDKIILHVETDEGDPDDDIYILLESQPLESVAISPAIKRGREPFSFNTFPNWELKDLKIYAFAQSPAGKRSEIIRIPQM